MIRASVSLSLVLGVALLLTGCGGSSTLRVTGTGSLANFVPLVHAVATPIHDAVVGGAPYQERYEETQGVEVNGRLRRQYATTVQEYRW